ncbi:MAG: hypothetical protein L6V93_20090 [Clostridiales bacterium]|nr:MAG: hypothetical protein L6V93_20090 [Clostridiales bacterium]
MTLKTTIFAAFDRYADEIKTEFDKIGARYAPKRRCSKLQYNIWVL